MASGVSLSKTCEYSLMASCIDINSGSSHGKVNKRFGSIGFFRCGAMDVATAQRVISH